jgi:hypothetical protein
MDADRERALAGNFDFLRDVIVTVGEGKAGVHKPPLPMMITMLVPTWCQTTLAQAALGAPIMTPSPPLIGLMSQHGYPQVGYLLDTSSWECGHGLMVPPCSRNAHDKAVLVRRAQWGNHSARDLKEVGGNRATRGLRRMRRERPGAFLARRTRTMRQCSFDARSKGQPWPLPPREK